MRFIRGGWYVAALSSAITEKPFGTWITGLPIVFYRKRSGDVVALEDRCAHRHVPLSMGDRIEDDLRCRYHGFRYSPDGRCVDIPGQSVVPKAICVNAYPVLERYGLVWIWPGYASSADASLIPAYPWINEPGFVQDWIELTIDAPLLAVVENLLDLSHLPFAHRLLGIDNPVHEAALQVDTTDNSISCVRDLQQSDELIIRYATHYHLPGVVNASVTPVDRLTGERREGFTSNSLHCLTPVSELRVKYFALKSWNERTSPAEIDAMRELNRVTLDEDRVILESMVEMKRTSDPLPRERLVAADRAAVAARRAYSTWLAKETRSAAGASLKTQSNSPSVDPSLTVVPAPA